MANWTKKQANAIVQAILEPDLKAQEEIRRKRADEAAKLAAQQRLAVFVLAGFAIGAAIGHFAFGRFSLGGLVGAFAAMVIGQLTKRHAA